MRFGLATLLGLLAALVRGPVPRTAETKGSGFRLELQTAQMSGKTVIEVRIRNEGGKAVMVNKRFAYAGLGNPIAELTFEGQPGPFLGCRFNVRRASLTDYVLLDRGEFVGRSFDLTLLDCFVGHSPNVKLRAHYRDKSNPARSGEVLTEELVSNEISLTGATLTPQRGAAEP